MTISYDKYVKRSEEEEHREYLITTRFEHMKKLIAELNDIKYFENLSFLRSMMEKYAHRPQFLLSGDYNNVVFEWEQALSQARQIAALTKDVDLPSYLCDPDLKAQVARLKEYYYLNCLKAYQYLTK